MSSSALCAIFNSKARTIREYRNGWGSGPVVWGEILVRIGRDRFDTFGDMSPVWGAVRNPEIPLGIRACLVMSFDFALVPRDRMTAMAELVSDGGRLIGESASEYVNHWPQIASDMAELSSPRRLDYRAIGVGVCCTSVSDVWRAWKPGEGQPFDAFSYLMESTHDESGAQKP